MTVFVCVEGAQEASTSQTAAAAADVQLPDGQWMTQSFTDQIPDISDGAKDGSVWGRLGLGGSSYFALLFLSAGVEHTRRRTFRDDAAEYPLRVFYCLWCMIVFMAVVFLNLWNQGLDNDARLSWQEVVCFNIVLPLYCTVLYCTDAVVLNIHAYCYTTVAETPGSCFLPSDQREPSWSSATWGFS